MKKIIFLFLSAFVISCGNNNQQSKIESNEISDSVREKLLQEKKERLEVMQRDESNDSSLTIDFGDIRFTPFVPPYPALGSEGIAMLENKINSLITKFGVASMGGNPSFVIIPAINIISKNVTSTAPTMYANTYQVIFYTACLTDGTIFSSADFSFKGVGESLLKSFINGIESANFDESRFKKLLSDGKLKAVKYYETHCENILQEAKTDVAQKQFPEAILLLKAIPKEVSCYNNAGELLEKYFKMSLSEDCNQLLAQMKSELGKQSEIGGFNAQAMSYYAMIPTDAPCNKEAQSVYSNYLKKLDPKAKEQWQKDEREFNLRKDKQDQDHTYAMTKAELESKTAIEGQTALLDKYKKDYEYQKLPWLRKLVHLGEWDPFDPTSKINK